MLTGAASKLDDHSANEVWPGSAWAVTSDMMQDALFPNGAIR